MREATVETVLGDFDNAKFVYEGVTTTFFKKEDKYWVNTDNEKGELADYPVEYVFGVYPLQQLLLPTEKGSLNALSIAWDSRKAVEGGRRWYHIYEDQEPVTSDSPLHWTGIYHNWNSRCAECHSTNVVKGYDPKTRGYQTPMTKSTLAASLVTAPALITCVDDGKGKQRHPPTFPAWDRQRTSRRTLAHPSAPIWA